LKTLAEQLGQLPNKISIEGHTDAKPFAGKRNYSNWELSADRANAARRIMQESGVKADQVSQVRGYADQRLRKPDAPEDASNRRISLIVQYLVKTDEEEDEAPGGEKSGAEAHEKISKNVENAAGKDPASDSAPAKSETVTPRN
jgi:chemotaxis protein MotB